MGRIARQLEGGAVVLLHDAAERDDFVPASVEALPGLLDAIERRGLRVVPLEDLMALARPVSAAQTASTGIRESRESRR